MIDVMIDLETLGTHPASPVFEIGLLEFNQAERSLGQRLRLSVSPDLSVANADALTVAWWLRQSEGARMNAAACLEGGWSEVAAAREVNDFLAGISPSPHEVRVWANGASFDLPILGALIRRAGSRPHWSYQNERCVRTLLKAQPKPPETECEGEPHTVMTDCEKQAKQVFATLDHLGLREWN